MHAVRSRANRFGLGSGFGQAAAFGLKAALLFGKRGVEVGAGSRLRGARASGSTLRLRNGLRARRGDRPPAVCRMDDGPALAFRNFALDFLADLAGSFDTSAGCAFFVVKLRLGPGFTALVFVFAGGLLLFARTQPVGKGGGHCDDELEMVENPVHGEKGREPKRRKSLREMRMPDARNVRHGEWCPSESLTETRRCRRR